MKKLILASTAAIAMFGLAACSDTDETTTQSIPETSTVAPVTPSDDAAMTDDSELEEPVETESVAPESPDAPVE